MDRPLHHLDVPRQATGATLPWRIRFRAVQRSARPRLQTPEHLSPHHQLMIVREGTYHGRIDGVAVSTSGACIVATGPGERHADVSDLPLKVDAMQFMVLPGPTPERSMPLMRPGRGRLTQLAPTTLAEVIAAVDALVGSALAPLDIRPHLQDALAAGLVWRWLGMQAVDDRHEDVATILARDIFARNLLELFERHARHALTVQQMAGLLEMPQRTLDWQCRRAFGTSPAQLFRRHRLRMARAHLLSGHASVAQIAARFGFPSASHFARVYRAEFLRTPGQDLRHMLA